VLGRKNQALASNRVEEKEASNQAGKMDQPIYVFLLCCVIVAND
jgi:hypothetical protein